jgi:hypothetical protein
MKLQYIASSLDDKAKGIVTAEYIAHRIANQTIGMISIPESGQAFRFSLSDGTQLKFQLTASGADVTHYVANKK